MKPILTLLTALLIGAATIHAHKGHTHQTPIEVPQSHITAGTQWQGKRVAFLGDSMTDRWAKNSSRLYWAYLQELMGIEPYVYAKSGNRWKDMLKRAHEMHEQHGDSIDVIMLWAGTNDYNSSVPIGSFFTETTDSVNHNGQMVARRHRTPVMDESTLCGSINLTLDYLKTNYPESQIIILTPIHRGYARFSDRNVQPDENYANGQGLYIDDYVDVIRKAASVWAMPLIDMFSLSGLHPMTQGQRRYFHHPDTDMLHPDAKGNYRLARTLQMQLLTLPADF